MLYNPLVSFQKEYFSGFMISVYKHNNYFTINIDIKISGCLRWQHIIMHWNNANQKVFILYDSNYEIREKAKLCRQKKRPVAYRNSSEGDMENRQSTEGIWGSRKICVILWWENPSPCIYENYGLWNTRYEAEGNLLSDNCSYEQ